MQAFIEFCNNDSSVSFNHVVKPYLHSQQQLFNLLSRIDINSTDPFPGYVFIKCILSKNIH